MGSPHSFSVQKAVNILSWGHITYTFHSMRKSVKDVFLRMYTNFHNMHAVF